MYDTILTLKQQMQKKQAMCKQQKCWQMAYLKLHKVVRS